MSNEVDARGLLCPQPVILTKRALDAMGVGVLTVRVDNAIAKENVRKLATSLGCVVDVAAEAGGFALRLTKGEAAELQEGAAMEARHCSEDPERDSVMTQCGEVSTEPAGQL